MTRIVCIIIIALTFLMLFQVLPVAGQEEQMQKEWTGKLPDGKILTKNSLKNFLADHKKWIKTYEKEGKKANLSRANLSRVDLSGADLSEANLYKANLYKANLIAANLYEADLRGANLSEANLYRANLYKTNLIAANLYEADLRGANLSEANLSRANLSKADLSGANLSRTNLIRTDLSGADLIEGNLSGAYLYEANLGGANFQPKLESIPKIKEIDYALNLSELTYSDRPKSLVALREEFKKSGMRKQEREITHAIKQTQMKILMRDYDLFKKFEAIFNFVFFDLTCEYGMKPGRPLILILPLIIIFAIPYVIVLNHPPKKDGIWKAWIPDRARKDLGAKEPYRLNLKIYSAIGFGFYFSVLSAFSIGWRELNVGNWIARMQPREYRLRASGWVRTVSGIQSLISVYLVALWALTYFGRPFDAV